MIRNYLAIILAASLSTQAAELQIELDKLPVDQAPAGFKSLLNGKGQPGEWKIILDDVPPALAPLTAQAKSVTKRRVLAQVSTDPTDERFPILVYEGESFGDFQITSRFKTVSGKVERMAGIVFRLQDENNFYVVRASSLGNTFRFYKVVEGVRTAPIGPEMIIPSGEWHEITVSCAGNKIDCFLNGKQAIPTLTDNSFVSGKVGLWTKSDSVSYFTDIRLKYTPRIPLAQTLIEDAFKRYGRLIGLRIYSTVADKEGLSVIASNKPEEVGLAAKDEYRSIMEGKAYAYGNSSKTTVVSLPLRDRNGDVAGIVRVEMERFLGQTENNAVVRAIPVVKMMEQRVKSKRDLLE